MSREHLAKKRSGLLFLLLGLVLSVTMRQILSTKSVEVPFSHQVEHLVNLDLLQEQRKVALSDNLVTFSGSFRQQLPALAQRRYRYLQLLSTRHQLSATQQGLREELKALRQEMEGAVQWLARWSGDLAPEYWLLPPGDGAALRLPAGSTPFPNNLRALQQQLATAPPSQLPLYQQRLLAVIAALRSPTLGIGDAALKKRLYRLEKQPPATVAQCRQVVETLQGIATRLADQRLLSCPLLRSARNYQRLQSTGQKVAQAVWRNGEQLKKERAAVADVVWYFNNQEHSTRLLEQQDPEAFLHWFEQAKREWQRFPSNQGATFRSPDQPCNTVLEKTFKSEEPSPNYLSHFLTTIPVLLLIVLLYLSFWRQLRSGGSGAAMSFGRSPARLLLREEHQTTFKDVAGCQEAKEELQEIVEFLRNPLKFTVLGAKIPRGVLCIGAPGTGKTLIAKAVAGEANRPFFSISGSDFVEMFVGVGASRIRDLFAQAKRCAPCIIFMDEIDAVGRHRGTGIGGGHDEREQTLNQLLVEMDGFAPNEGIILIAATNRPDVLDSALLRPGRFDRRIIIDLPDVRGRYEILRVHARHLQIDPGVELMDLARTTPGASGADLANILNEAALLAARLGKRAITAAEVAAARDKVRYGKERKSLQLDRDEKRATAYHESGHALVALSVEHADPVDKVTIIPRGLALGATHFMPEKQRLNYWKRELLDRLAVLMGGRAAEEIFIGDISNGAQSDLLRATQLVRNMACKWGMDNALGLVSYPEHDREGLYFLPPEQRYSESTAQQIDAAVRQVLDEAYQRACRLLKAHAAQVELMSAMLMEFETLDRTDVQEIFAGCWQIEKKRERLQAAAKAGTEIASAAPTAQEASATAL